MAKKLIPIEGESSYCIDNQSHALINTDTQMLMEHRAKRKNILLLKEMQNEINILKKEVAKLKTHLDIR